MTGTGVSLLPPRCALCTRPFPGRRAIRCDRCQVLVCRMGDRACWALHKSEVHR